MYIRWGRRPFWRSPWTAISGTLALMMSFDYTLRYAEFDGIEGEDVWNMPVMKIRDRARRWWQIHSPCLGVSASCHPQNHTHQVSTRFSRRHMIIPNLVQNFLNDRIIITQMQRRFPMKRSHDPLTRLKEPNISWAVWDVQDNQHGRCVVSEENPWSSKQGPIFDLHQIQAIWHDIVTFSSVFMS